MEQKGAVRNKTQPDGRNHTFWKVFSRILNRNVTRDASEAPEPDLFIDFQFTVMQKHPIVNIQWTNEFLLYRDSRAGLCCSLALQVHNEHLQPFQGHLQNWIQRYILIAK